jgi:hypothetical protein
LPACLPACRVLIVYLAKFGYILYIKVGNNNNNNNNNPFIFLDTCWNLSSKSEDLENK